MDEMRRIDVMGKPCPVPVVEARKTLAEDGVDSVLVMVDNTVAVQNLERMANSFGYEFGYTEKLKDVFEIMIRKDGSGLPGATDKTGEDQALRDDTASRDLVVVISRDTMGEGAEELGKILLKGFVYSLTELPTPPKQVIFLNSGVRLTSDGANTIEDIKKLEQNGTEILTCGTCVNYYGIQDKLGVGEITNMYGITERIAAAGNVINI